MKWIYFNFYVFVVFKSVTTIKLLFVRVHSTITKYWTSRKIPNGKFLSIYDCVSYCVFYNMVWTLKNPFVGQKLVSVECSKCTIECLRSYEKILKVMNTSGEFVNRLFFPNFDNHHITERPVIVDDSGQWMYYLPSTWNRDFFSNIAQ